MKIRNLTEEAVRPRILLLDFEESEAQILRDLGYKVYLGRTGLNGNGFYLPIEPYRIDIAFYRCSYSLISKDVEPQEGKIKLASFCTHFQRGNFWFTYPEVDPLSKGNWEALGKLRDYIITKGGVLINFVGKGRLYNDYYLLKQFLSLDEDTNPFFEEGGEEGEYELEFNTQGIMGTLGDYSEDLMTGKLNYIAKYITGIHASKFNIEAYQGVSSATDEDANIFAHLLKTSNNAVIGFLPDFASSNIKIIKDLLGHLNQSCGEGIFSRTYDAHSWIEQEPFMFNNEIKVLQEKKNIQENFGKSILDLEEKQKKSRVQTNQFRAILTNGDDANVDESEKLVPPIKVALEWLGIVVKELDEDLIRQEKALMNDLILIIDGTEIVCEVKGTTSGPKGDYVGQVQSHIIRYSNLTKKPALSGLLILNYQRDKNPNHRSSFYTDVASIESAKGSQIGLLDTRELFKICKHIFGNSKEVELKAKARRLLLSHGIINIEDL